LTDLRAALQDLVAANPDATVTLIQGQQQVFGGGDTAPVRADLLLADEAVIAALLEGRELNLTLEVPRTDGEPDVIIAIEASTQEDCTVPICVAVLQLPAELAGLDLGELREALGAMIARDADATLAVVRDRDRAVVRADLLLGLSDPVLNAVVSGETLSVTLNLRGDIFLRHQ
jgi:hypothetical protein